ncbi:MAG: Fur family transcriptional regulator [Chloroflexi bacterium]|nr:Fur family transcriptional regulator [Chloroflexota bacterium]
MGTLYIDRLRQAGYRLTEARLTVLRVLVEERKHLTSGDVLQRVNQINPAVGRASVFRALDLFTRLGIVRPIFLKSSLTPSYVMLYNDHHHHVICTNCDRYFDFLDCGLENLTAELQETLDFKISGHLLEFYGICSACNS